MTGGTIGSLNQGDGLDTFFMSGGRIVDFFDDGDRAVMTGGRIGRVNMRLDRNFFDMSGGIIDRNLVTGFDIDTIILSGGFIGGNISVSGGADSVTVSGGTLVGSVLMSTGADSFVWDSGGSIAGTIDMGIDNDMARLANLAAANIGATAAIDGGLGTDALTLQNVVATGIARIANWETIDATQGTALTFDGTLVLGDAGTGTGALSVDAASTLFGGGGNFGIAGFSTGASLLNAGKIDLTNGSTGPGDSFTIAGDYTGDGGSLRLETTLGDDASPSDRLVVSGGTASGTTGIDIVNFGGAGAVTNLDGILLVDAINGGTTSGSAFSLASRAAAGPYEYLLFRGGVSAGSDQNWYLRSTIVPGPQPAPPPPGAPPPSPGATPQAGEFVPLYRPEVATYSAIVPVGHRLALSALGTFHERRGDQPLLGGAGALPPSWARVYGVSTRPMAAPSRRRSTAVLPASRSGRICSAARATGRSTGSASSSGGADCPATSKAGRSAGPGLRSATSRPTRSISVATGPASAGRAGISTWSSSHRVSMARPVRSAGRRSTYPAAVSPLRSRPEFRSNSRPAGRWSRRRN